MAPGHQASRQGLHDQYLLGQGEVVENDRGLGKRVLREMIPEQVGRVPGGTGSHLLALLKRIELHACRLDEVVHGLGELVGRFQVPHMPTSSMRSSRAPGMPVTRAREPFRERRFSVPHTTSVGTWISPSLGRRSTRLNRRAR